MSSIIACPRSCVDCCGQPACACEVHHITHKADGGKTTVNGGGLYCSFHRQAMTHKLGWKVILHPDGTTSAISPDGTKILCSHSPPASEREHEGAGPI